MYSTDQMQLKPHLRVAREHVYCTRERSCLHSRALKRSCTHASAIIAINCGRNVFGCGT